MTVIRLPTPPSSAGAELKKHSQAGHGNPVLYHYTRVQTTCPWTWWWEGPIPSPTRTDEVSWIVAPTAACLITTCTGFMTSDFPETKKTPYTIRDVWYLLAAEVWTIVELTLPPPTQDAGDITQAKATKPEETEALHATSAVKGHSSEEAKTQASGLSTEKNKENCEVNSVKAKSDSLGLSAENSCHVAEGNQMPDLSKCHEYENDNSQAFAEWKGSSQPTCPKWGPPPHLGGHPSGSSCPESQNNPSDTTASIERSCGHGPNVPPFN